MRLASTAELGGEDDELADVRVLERLHAEPVAGDEPASAAGVPTCRPTSLAAPRRPPRRGAEDLGVAARAQPVTGILEAAPDRGVVGELAVLDGEDRPALVAHRLVPTRATPTMLSRLAPSAKSGRETVPRSSGPRWVIASVIPSSTSCSTT